MLLRVRCVAAQRHMHEHVDAEHAVGRRRLERRVEAHVAQRVEDLRGFVGHAAECLSVTRCESVAVGVKKVQGLGDS
eukprot:352431-Chlamydomonas_euryale.AAC.1